MKITQTQQENEMDVKEAVIKIKPNQMVTKQAAFVWLFLSISWCVCDAIQLTHYIR